MANLELDADAIQKLTAVGLTKDLLQSRDFITGLRNLVSLDIRNDTVKESMELSAELKKIREMEKEHALKQIQKNSEEAVIQAKKEMETYVQSRLISDINRGWQSPGQKWIEEQTKEIIRENVKNAFNRTSHKLAQRVLEVNDARLKELLDQEDLKAFKNEIYQSVGATASVTADKILGGHMARLEMLFDEDFNNQHIRDQLEKK